MLALDSLCALCLEFEKRRNAKIKIDDMSISKWKRSTNALLLRAHVNVKPKNREGS